MTSLWNTIYNVARVYGVCAWVGEGQSVSSSGFLLAAYTLSKLNTKIFIETGAYVLIQNQKLNLMLSQICLQLNKHK